MTLGSGDEDLHVANSPPENISPVLEEEQETVNNDNGFFHVKYIYNKVYGCPKYVDWNISGYMMDVTYDTSQ